LKQKFKADAVERTAHVRHICELEKQITALADKSERLAYEKKVLVDDIIVYKDLIEKQKQSVSDARCENEQEAKILINKLHSSIIANKSKQTELHLFTAHSILVPGKVT